MNKQVFGNDKEVIEKIVKIDNDISLGYEIHTSKQVITIFINNQPGCCESWGTITTEDTLKDFIKSELLSMAVVDYEYNKHPLFMKESSLCSSDEVGAIFVDINTSNGLLQFVLYNQHNGYYGHSVNVKSDKINFHGIV